MPLDKRQKLKLLMNRIGAEQCTFQAERNAKMKHLISTYPRIILTFNMYVHTPEYFKDKNSILYLFSKSEFVLNATV